jgi:CRP-like cAMP-binding protein
MVSPELLRRFSCFSPISEESLKSLAMITKEECVQAGHRLFGEGEPADSLGLILDGEVDIQCLLRGGELCTVDTLTTGEILGWPALVEPYKMTCIATTRKQTHMLRIEAKRLHALCEQDPLLGYRLTSQVVRLLAERLDGTRAQLAAV